MKRCRQNDRFLIILDLDRLFTADELDTVQAIRDITETTLSAQPAA